MLSSFRLYYIQFKEVKILWVPRPGAGGLITQTPFKLNCWKRWVYFDLIKGTLMQTWTSANIFVFLWKWYVEEFTLKHLLLSEICTRAMYEKFDYKHSETI